MPTSKFAHFLTKNPGLNTNILSKAFNRISVSPETHFKPPQGLGTKK